MVNVLFDEYFKKNFEKIKDSSLKERIIKQISKIKDNPEIGKPLMNNTMSGLFSLKCRTLNLNLLNWCRYLFLFVAEYFVVVFVVADFKYYADNFNFISCHIVEQTPELS